jgi:RNase P/RNase MRP subunit p30
MEKEIVQGKDIEFNRKALESRKTKILTLSHTNKKDKLKQRDSGLNQVLCKIARDNNIILAIDMNELKVENKKTKALILSRIMQNIKLIKKYKNNFKLINYSNKEQAFSFLISLGMPTDMAKKAVE